jgi:hypothetical protein
VALGSQETKKNISGSSNEIFVMVVDKKIREITSILGIQVKTKHERVKL